GIAPPGSTELQERCPLCSGSAGPAVISVPWSASPLGLSSVNQWTRRSSSTPRESLGALFFANSRESSNSGAMGCRYRGGEWQSVDSIPSLGMASKSSLDVGQRQRLLFEPSPPDEAEKERSAPNVEWHLRTAWAV